MIVLMHSSQDTHSHSIVVSISLFSPLRDPVVCAVTSIGHDHTHLLGHTLSSIAWYKAGIFKVCLKSFLCTQLLFFTFQFL